MNIENKCKFKGEITLKIYNRFKIDVVKTD